MERRWKRSVDYLRLSVDEVNVLIAGSGFEAVRAALIAVGKANTNYQLTLATGGHVLLRIYQRDPKVGALENALSHLVPPSALAPAFLHFDSELKFAVLEWRPGVAMESLLAIGRSAEVLTAAPDLGRVLAAISSVKFDQAGFLTPELTVCEAWSSTLDGLMGYARYLLGSDLVQARLGQEDVTRTEVAIEAARPRLAEVGGQPCLVHGDFKPSNLLIQEGRLSAVVDWEFAHSGTWLMSVGQLFRYESTLPDGFEPAFAEAFTSAGGVLPPDWRQLGKIIDLLSLLDFLSRSGLGEDVIGDVKALIRATTGP